MKRGMKQLVLGALFLAVAFLLFVFTFVSLYRGASLDDQFKAIGRFTVHATDTGRYYIWDNYKTVFDGKRIEHGSGFPKEILIEVRDGAGRRIEFSRDHGQSWVIGNHAKRSIGYIVLRESGEMTVEVKGGNGARILSFGKANMSGELWQRLRGFAFAVIAFILGVPMVIWGLIGVFRSSKRAAIPGAPKI